MFTLEILHVTDQEASGGDINDIPRLSAVLNALRAEDLGGDGIEDNTLTLSSGDAFLPGLFYEASGPVFGTPGIADIVIQNLLGFEAIAFGNHEFDFGTEVLAALIDGSAEGEVFGADFAGTAFPYLSANLDFSTDANLAPLAVAGGLAPQGNVVAPSTVIEVGGELIGVVGATTPTLAVISNPGEVGILPEEFGGTPTPEALDALAEVIQSEVDALLAANPDMNKVILLAHMQRIDVEFALAERLENVDVIVAGGSNTRLVDETDRLRDGDSAQGDYPTVVTNAGGTDTLVVSTDGNYKYVGRLVIDFDEDGNVIADSYDAEVSGAYATDAEGVAALGAEDLADADLAAVVAAIQDQIVETEGNVFGISSEFLNGNRTGDGSVSDPDGVRSQETNLGNLTADANLAIAKEADDTVVVSIKNGGGIRASIGETFVPPGSTGEAERLPNRPVLDADGNEVKPEGGISETDIARTLAFNNELTLLTLTRAELVAVLEHAVGDIGGGRFPQVAGLRFSFDPDAAEGERIQTAAIVDEAGSVVAPLVEGGETVGDPAETFRIVTLNFLAGGGDGYPFPQGDSANRVDLVEEGVRTGAATFADDGSEQDALAEYLAANFADADSAFDAADLGTGLDARIQNLAARSDTVLAPAFRDELTVELVQVFDGGGEAGSEVVSHDAGLLFVTNGAFDRVDVFDLATGEAAGAIDLTGIEGYNGIQSVAVKNGIGVAVVDIEPDETGAPQPGRALVFDAATLELIAAVETGNLPDSVAASPDGTLFAIANEGEFNSESDLTENAPGGITIVDVSDLDNITATTVGFEDAGDLIEDAIAEGLRLLPGVDPVLDLEPEYVAFTPDGASVFVSLQEANAVAEFDLATLAWTSIDPVGTTDHSAPGFGLDANDDDVIDIRTFENLVGMRMPDAIAVAEIGGAAYFFTANEGDGRGDGFDDEGNVAPNGDEARVSDLIELGLIDESVDTTGLERLAVSTIDGDTDGDGDIDVLHAFSSRSFTIFDEAGTVVFDSGEEIERILANIAPERFLDDDGELGQNRADAKGAEIEAIAVGQVGLQTYAFIGAERDSGVFVYNVTDPADARFVTYLDGFESGNLSPETIVFIPAEESTSGNAQIAVAHEITGTTAVYELSRLEEDVTTESFYQIALGRTVDIDGFDFWSDLLALSSDELLAEAFELSNEFQGQIAGLEEPDAIDFVFGNALGREATEEEQAGAAALVAEDGFSGLFLELLDGSFDNPLA